MSPQIANRDAVLTWLPLKLDDDKNTQQDQQQQQQQEQQQLQQQIQRLEELAPGKEDSPKP